MSMFSKNAMYRFVQDLPTIHRAADYVEKKTTTHDLLGLFPSPKNTDRNLSKIPNIDVELLLSTTSRLPQIIRERVEQCEHPDIFNDNDLLGLCLNGQELGPRIFLHTHRMQQLDFSGKLTEEILWHEYVHAMEGTRQTHDGLVFRDRPWSYDVQKEMLAMDAVFEHADAYPDASEKMKQHIHYLREGTSLQGNVSEVFARAAMGNMLHIREHGVVPAIEDAATLFQPVEPKKHISPLERNRYDFQLAFNSFGVGAQGYLLDRYPKMMERVAGVFGYDPVCMGDDLSKPSEGRIVKSPNLHGPVSRLG